MHPAASIEDRWLQQINALLQQHRHIDLHGYKQAYVFRRISARVRLTGSSDMKDYVAYIQKQPAELDRLVDTFAINISSFFRNPEVFEGIAALVFQTWLREPERRTRHVWSCACAQGEEPYSLSLLWEEWIQRKARAGVDLPELKILACDIDRDALQKGEKGVYASKLLAPVPEKFRKFLILEETGFRLKPEIKRRVHFVCENVFAPGGHPKFDLILCRNLLIFLDRAQQSAMLKVLHRSLSDSGCLVLGRAESMWGDERSLFHGVDASNRIYQKIIGVRG